MSLKYGFAYTVSTAPSNLTLVAPRCHQVRWISTIADRTTPLVCREECSKSGDNVAKMRREGGNIFFAISEYIFFFFFQKESNSKIRLIWERKIWSSESEKINWIIFACILLLFNLDPLRSKGISYFFVNSIFVYRLRRVVFLYSKIAEQFLFPRPSMHFDNSFFRIYVHHLAMEAASELKRLWREGERGRGRVECAIHLRGAYTTISHTFRRTCGEIWMSVLRGIAQIT